MISLFEAWILSSSFFLRSRYQTAVELVLNGLRRIDQVGGGTNDTVTDSPSHDVLVVTNATGYNGNLVLDPGRVIRECGEKLERNKQQVRRLRKSSTFEDYLPRLHIDRCRVGKFA